MQKFTDDLIVKSLGNKWELVEPFSFYYEAYNDIRRVIVIPKGFITDFASTPAMLYSIFPPIGLYNKAAMIHDYLYSTKTLPRKNADLYFLQAMKVLGVSKWRRYAMYYAVRLFGSKSYNK
jgi:hypothetical protein